MSNAFGWFRANVSNRGEMAQQSQIPQEEEDKYNPPQQIPATHHQHQNTFGLQNKQFGAEVITSDWRNIKPLPLNKPNPLVGLI